MTALVDYVVDLVMEPVTVFTKGFELERVAWSERFPDFTYFREQGMLLPALSDVFYIFGMIVVFLALVPPFHFRVLPAIGRKLGLKKAAQLMKFSDASLQVIYFSFILLWEGYICLTEPWAIRLEYFGDVFPITQGMRWVYIIQLAWYSYGLILVIFVPSTRRKDIVVMVIHHIVTISVVTLSYVTNNARIGLVVFALHDPADVFLNAAKVANYFHFQKVCDSLFVVFALVWVITRDTLFPIVTNTAYQMLKLRASQGFILPGDMFETLSLWILVCLHIYWSVLIFRMAYRAIIVKQVEGDIRSDDDE